MTVRFFGGWQYAHGDQQNPHLPWVGYAKGVPMGSDLPPWVAANAAPSFLVLALKDPEGANLDRIQIVKGRLDAEDDSLERIYDVALSDGRTPDTRGVPPVGSSVDVANASDTNSLGTVQLAAVWRDPDFDAKRPAFYYARVLEIPTPPWTTYEAKRFGSAIPDGTPRTHQERAYTSPIWYTPSRAN